MVNNQKLIVAKEIAKRVQHGQLIGIGSGSTAELAIEEIGKRIKNEGLKLRGLSTSSKTTKLSKKVGIEILEINSGLKPDWAFDGADEVDENLNLIKGGGGCHLIEKVVAALAGGITVIVGEDKLSKKLGEKFLVPVEFIPEASLLVEEQLKTLGAEKIKLRASKGADISFLTDKQNNIFDVSFQNKELTEILSSKINNIPGVVENGLFFDLTKEVIVGSEEGVKVIEP